MASFISEEGGLSEPPRKRQKLSLSPPTSDTTTLSIEDCNTENAMLKALRMANEDLRSQLEREAEAGILRFVTLNNLGFSGILKQRYTDFIVNEIGLDGNVIHLTNITFPRQQDTRKVQGSDSSSNAGTVKQSKVGFEAPIEASQSAVTTSPAQTSVELKAASGSATAGNCSMDDFALSSEDTALLDSYFGAELRRSIISIYKRILQKPTAKLASFGAVSTQPIADRQLRTQMHKDIRRIFESRLETSGSADGIISIFAARQLRLHLQQSRGQGNYGRGSNRGNEPRGKLGWQELGGEYLHFSLYKENRDTMEVINFIARGTKIGAKKFKFSGTKDRRAVTVQRASIFRVHAEQLFNLNRSLQGAKLGDFKYEKYSLELGDLMGNEFLITLRDCRFHGVEKLNERRAIALADKVIGDALKNLREHGFINYYGLQRFGSFSVGTDEIGLKILQNDFEGAVSAILTYNEEALASALDPEFAPKDQKSFPQEDKARAHAIHVFQTTGNSHLALEKMPKKFHAESSVIRHLGQQDQIRDFIGALLTINRNLRLMYLHAYQSLVWNMVASERWARFGRSVMQGDLVIDEEQDEDGGVSLLQEEVDENGEVIVVPGEYDAAVSRDQFDYARALTAEEAASGKYTIFDIVLPTPGHDVEYPRNEIGDYYKEFMASEKGGGLDPAYMFRKHRDFTLTGNYRKLLARVGEDFSYQIKTYIDDNEQMVETDLERILRLKSNAPLPNTGRQATLDRENHLKNSPQLDAWRNLPAKLAADDKAAAGAFAAEKFAKGAYPELFPTHEISQPTIKETYIQTSPTVGGRTGHRETKIMSPINSAKEKPAAPTTVAYIPMLAVPKPSFTPTDAELPTDFSPTNLWKKPETPLLQTSSRITEISLQRLWKPKTNVSPGVASPETDTPMSGVLTPGTTTSSTVTKPATSASTPCFLEATGSVYQSATTDFNDAQSSSSSDDQIVRSSFPRHLKRPIDLQMLEEARRLQEIDDANLANPKKIAVIVKFRLSSSQYATMALRELMSGGVQTYQSDFSRGKGR